MRASSRRFSVIAWVLLTATWVYTSGNASEQGVRLPEDFLEYLGTLVDQDGEWVDALELNALESNDEALPDDDVQQTLENDDLASSSNAPSTTGEAEEE